ncbi:hypothetical protein EPUL_005781 [Erysiphe pulchra]|uniref:Uncharacterized protein n=1 Tax=Erysiphe pulchra TaxID=225359 RepID=A0A2S4PK69_9PEZI|nr:hypothetical protein EPUL_005781 [Erysiphe pulchra]
MDISQETHDSSMERSHQPPPIPPIPPILNSPSPFASPTPPLNLEEPTKTSDGRQILKPVAPSKRPIIERPTPSCSNEISTGNAFLPKELAEIVAIRQHRERAWHASLMICKTAISSIESTLANSKEEIEKEEVAAFKAYLQLAIANFAAVDSSPSPPQIPTHTRPTKGDRKGKDKSNTKKESSKRDSKSTKYSSYIRKYLGYSAASQRLALSDKRLFVRLPQEHEWRKLSPAGIREVIVKKLHISPSLIGRIKPVHSGFALSPCSPEASEEIIKAGNGLFLSGAKLETATNWASVLVPTVPASIKMEQGLVEVSKSMLADEIERVCSVRPAHLKLYGGNKPESPHRTWLAYFSKAPRGGFRVFDESGIVRPYKKQQPLEFCKRCNGHHPSKNCSRAPSCANCGSTNHTADICMAATKCRNCGGPHRADSRRCLARPTRSGAPSKEQMKTYRRMGEREYHAVQRARAAEEKAANVYRTDIDLTSSQLIEDSMIDENSQATPVEDTTAVASRL